MATSTYKSFLMYKASGSSDYTKLCDVKNYPDLGGEPERLETTTQSDPIQTYINGIQSLDSLSYTANYDPTLLSTLEGLKDQELDFAEWFGGTESGGVVTPTGSEGKFNFKGYLSAYATGKGVNEVREINISIANTTAISFSAT